MSTRIQDLPHDRPPLSSRDGLIVVAILAVGTAVVFLAVDLVLPAIPSLPGILGGTTATAQLVLAAYIGGMAIGLVVIGWAADHMDRRVIFIGSLGAFGLLTIAAGMAPSIEVLIVLRFFQGAIAAGPGVVAPGMIRKLFDDTRAVRVIGLLGSTQSLVPALAPIAGAWLFASFGWSSTFFVTGALAAVVFVILLSRGGLLPPGRSKASDTQGSYRDLLRSLIYLRYAVSYSLVLGGLIVFVFGAPAVIVKTMGGTITDFIVLQVIGVSTFILCANSSGFLLPRFGAELLIQLGILLGVASSVGFLGYALAGGNSPAMLIPIWIPMNIGMGLLGPTSYVKAIASADNNDARASALIGLFITGIAAIGTALVAPFLELGLVALSVAMAAIVVPALVLIRLVPAPKPALQS